MIATEDVIDAVYNRLDAGLETQLASIETARSVTITRWKKLARYFDRSRQSPRIIIVPGDMAIEYGNEDAPLTEGIGRPVVYIYVVASGTDPAASGDLLSRYAEAIVAVFLNDDTLGNAVDWGFATAVEWADFAVQIDDRTIESSIRVIVELKKHG